jgi:hypothetical protein
MNGKTQETPKICINDPGRQAQTFHIKAGKEVAAVIIKDRQALSVGLLGISLPQKSNI